MPVIYLTLMEKESNPNRGEQHSARVPEWQLSRDAAIAVLPDLIASARPLRSGDALIETDQTKEAKAQLETLYRIWPDLRPMPSEAR